MDIHTILDSNRCPIFYIIEDDKAIPVVAAINLTESVPAVSW